MRRITTLYAVILAFCTFGQDQPNVPLVQNYLGNLDGQPLYIGAGSKKTKNIEYLVTVKDSEVKELFSIDKSKSDTVYNEWFISNDRLYAVATYLNRPSLKVWLVEYNKDFSIASSRALFSTDSLPVKYVDITIRRQGSRLGIACISFSKESWGTIIYHDLQTATGYSQSFVKSGLSTVEYCTDICFNGSGELFAMLEWRRGFWYANKNERKKLRSVLVSCSKEQLNFADLSVKRENKLYLANFKFLPLDESKVLLGCTQTDSRTNFAGYYMADLNFGSTAVTNERSMQPAEGILNPDYWLSEKDKNAFLKGRQAVDNHGLKKICPLADGSYLFFSESEIIPANMGSVGGPDFAGGSGINSPTPTGYSGATMQAHYGGYQTSYSGSSSGNYAGNLIVSRITPAGNVSWTMKCRNQSVPLRSYMFEPSCVYKIDETVGMLKLFYGGKLTQSRWDDKQTAFFATCDLATGQTTTKELDLTEQRATLNTDASFFDEDNQIRLVFMRLTKFTFPDTGNVIKVISANP